MGKLSTRFVLAGAALMLAASPKAEINFNAVVSFPTENAGVYSFSTEGYNPQLIKNLVYASGGVLPTMTATTTPSVWRPSWG